MSFDAVRFTTRCLGEIWDLLVAESVSKGFLPTLNTSSFLQLTGMDVLSNFGYFLNHFISFFFPQGQQKSKLSINLCLCSVYLLPSSAAVVDFVAEVVKVISSATERKKDLHFIVAFRLL